MKVKRQRILRDLKRYYGRTYPVYLWHSASAGTYRKETE